MMKSYAKLLAELHAERNEIDATIRFLERRTEPARTAKAMRHADRALELHENGASQTPARSTIWRRKQKKTGRTGRGPARLQKAQQLRQLRQSILDVMHETKKPMLATDITDALVKRGTAFHGGHPPARIVGLNLSSLRKQKIAKSHETEKGNQTWSATGKALPAE